MENPYALVALAFGLRHTAGMSSHPLIDSGIAQLEQAERVKYLYGNGFLTIATNVVVPMTIAVMFWSTQPHPVLFGWAIAHVGLSLLRSLLILLYRNYGSDYASSSFWGWAFVIGSLFSGLLWGALPVLMLDVSSAFNVVTIILIIFGMIAGSISSNTAFYPAYVVYAVPAGSMLSLRLAQEGGEYFFLVGLLVVFLLVNLSFGWNHRKMLAESIRQRLLNEKLLKDVERKRVQAETASQDKSRFLAAVSHDLRQPLHALDLFHSSLKSKMESKDSRNLLGMAVQSSHALGEMLGELMDIARLDADKIVPNRSLFPLAPLLTDCIEEQRPLAKEKGLSLRYRSPLKGCVNSDPVLLKRILRNLLSNAIRHTESGGALLGTRMRGGAILVEVYDTGSGIEANALPYIFDEFYQVNNPERDREKGLGLGLSIVRRMASMLDHHVSVNSRPGRGTRFSLALPLCVAVKQCEPLAQLPKTEMHDLIGLFVLVVDDDRAILQGMRALLLGWGCEVLLAEGEDELMIELTAHDYPRPDLIISDYRLRGERTGLEVVARVRRHFNDAKLPSVIISGDVHPDVQQQVAAASCRWLEKPVAEADMKRLLAAVAGTEG